MAAIRLSRVCAAILLAAPGALRAAEADCSQTLVDGTTPPASAAFIVPADSDHPPLPEELSSFARRTLAGFKIPQYWYTVAELPLNSAGKVVRAELRDSHLKRQHVEST